jgi:hypothetical protein
VEHIQVCVKCQLWCKHRCSLNGQMYPIPPSTVTNGFGTTIDVLCCVGPPMVNTDGTAYLEYEVRNTVNDVVTSDTLYLLQINPDNSSSSTVLSATTQNETQYPGNIIPDGNGGVLATWSVSVVQGTQPTYPYEPVDFNGGAVGAPYYLPFSPQSVNIAQQPVLVLGENGVAFASGMTTATVNGTPTQVSQIASFNISSGASNWTYQAQPNSTLSIVAATSAAGIAINDSQQGVTQLDANGSPSQLIASAGSIAQTSLLGNWYLKTSQTISELFQAPLALAQSFWAFPGGSQSPSGLAIKQVQTIQTPGIAKQLPPSGSTLHTNYNSIEILTTESPGQIFQKYLQTFEGAWPGNNDVATVPATTNITGVGQNLTFTLMGVADWKPLVWLGLGQGPFSVQTERFDTTADTISAVTLQGHPLAGWRYWRVYSVGTNDVVIETGAADTSASGPINYTAYRTMKTKQIKIWQEYLQFVLKDIRSNGDPNATQGSNTLYNNVNGKWDPAPPLPSLTNILYNICLSTSCN